LVTQPAQILSLDRACPLAVEAVRRIDAIFDVERSINGLPVAQRLACRKQHVAPPVGALEDSMRAARGKMPRHADVAKAMDYMLRRWQTFSRFVDDGRICPTNNAAERALHAIATPGSLCTSSSSIWKHWKLICGGDVTRAPFTPSRLHYGRRVHVGDTDLERRTANDLLGGKDACLDQLADPVAGDAASLGCLAQGQPGPVLLGGHPVAGCQKGLQRLIRARAVHGRHGAEARELRRLMRALREDGARWGW
jgi:hypothetical protein